MPKIISAQKNVRQSYDHTQWLLTFDNGLSLSIINGMGTYGFEAALMRNGSILYDDNVFVDVVPHMDTEEMLNVISLASTFSPNHDDSSDYSPFPTPDNGLWTFSKTSSESIVIPADSDTRTALDYLVSWVNL